MEPRLPQGSIGVFRSGQPAKRGDIVLVDHPELGCIVRSVRAVARTGRVSLQSFSRNVDDCDRAGIVAPECIKGRLIFRVFGSGVLGPISKVRKRSRSHPAGEC